MAVGKKCLFSFAIINIYLICINKDCYYIEIIWYKEKGKGIGSCSGVELQFEVGNGCRCQRLDSPTTYG